ncbi:formate dehydrogenase accessory sulfurtransferase FdhD [Geoalkalibacter subterraneus]|jgi:FdhD protein|uniref:formate dehydrogenase accessory sulfurtransferase FdhD n=1 Tax=Geoalkalibacter subterraneus TaxID=483547 RepID=UPI000693F065|nr:formate dehydrogenase accessory sulfurtransferase FdhD [Geoalkalibacter subterraneus]
MTGTLSPRTTVRYEKQAFQQRERHIVQEFPLRLMVNERELATLVASPHQLNFLAVGFLRLQGFISTPDDILSLGVCSEFGLASIRLKKDIPERLTPTLTSGCGTGIVFNLPQHLRPSENEGTASPSSVDPQTVLGLMANLARLADNYSRHGGIHSAAVSSTEDPELFAEDLGRHNTLDRIAGEALFRGINLKGKLLVTSGRVSTEMVAKATRLGIALIASRTSPTDAAVELAQQAGITLIGYVRGGSFEVYAHHERLRQVAADGRISGITGVILAGGESRRMGCDKSLLPVAGARFIDHIYRKMTELFDEVIIVTNSPGLYQDIPCRKVPDIYYGRGALAGIHSGLCHAQNQRIFVAACDMPYLNTDLIRTLCHHSEQSDVVIPQSPNGLEPLHALYHKNCLGAIENTLDRGRRRIVHFFPQVRVSEVAITAVNAVDPQGKSFRNINTPEEYFHCRLTADGTSAPLKTSEEEQLSIQGRSSSG